MFVDLYLCTLNPSYVGLVKVQEPNLVITVAAYVLALDILLIQNDEKILRDGPLTRYAKLPVAHAPGMPGTFSPPQRVAIPICITARASRTCRDACRDSLLAVSFEVNGGENDPGIPGACAIHNLAYLVRGSYRGTSRIKSWTSGRYEWNLRYVIFNRNIVIDG